MKDKLFDAIRQSLNKNIGFNLSYLDNDLIEEARASINTNITDADLVNCVNDGDLNNLLYQEFLNKVLNHESYFFRHFSTIDEVIIPELIRNSGNDINVWSAGCSSGEEIYSIAISLDRHKHEFKPNQRVNLIGSDINQKILEKAKKAVYKSWSLRGNVPFDINIYFNRIADCYHLKDKIKDLVYFINKNILYSREPKTKFDLILCRNVLIYFDPKYIPLVIDNLYERMEDHSRLIVGHSENSDIFKEKFKLEIINDIVTFKKKIKKTKKLISEPAKEEPEYEPNSNDLLRAFNCFKKLKYNEALAILDKILLRAHDMYEAQLLKAIIQLNTGNLVVAKMLLKNLARQFPSEVEVHYFLGVVLKEETKTEEAINKFKEGLNLKKDNILCLLELKFLYEQLKDNNAVQYCINKINKVLENCRFDEEIFKYSDITYEDVKKMIS